MVVLVRGMSRLMTARLALLEMRMLVMAVLSNAGDFVGNLVFRGGAMMICI